MNQHVREPSGYGRRLGAAKANILLLGLICAMGSVSSVAHAAGTLIEAPKPDPVLETAKAEIWTKEQAIYAGRGRGDLGPYVDNTSVHYASWPPAVAAPLHYDALKAGAAHPKPARERLAMELTDFALSGDAAVIYYRTHLTVRADGTPADIRYEITHTWVREGGVWRVLGGMARVAPQR